MLKSFLHNQCPGCATDFKIALVVDSCGTTIPAAAVLKDRFDALDAEAFKDEVGKIFGLHPVEEAPELKAAKAAPELSKKRMPPVLSEEDHHALLATQQPGGIAAEFVTGTAVADPFTPAPPPAPDAPVILDPVVEGSNEDPAQEGGAQ
jgi:hypothetical protein